LETLHDWQCLVVIFNAMASSLLVSRDLGQGMLTHDPQGVRHL